jgi:hypothetical protein
MEYPPQKAGGPGVLPRKLEKNRSVLVGFEALSECLIGMRYLNLSLPF